MLVRSARTSSRDSHVNAFEAFHGSVVTISSDTIAFAANDDADTDQHESVGREATAR